MLPRIPLPRASREVRERNERRRPKVGAMSDPRCVICEAPLAGRLVGLNYHNPSDTVADPNEDLPDGGLQWVGAACARKVPAGYRIPWEGSK